MAKNKKTFVNTHTHIFTVKNVPPYIAKTFVPWPIYIFLHLSVVLKIYAVINWMEDIYKKARRKRRKLVNYFLTRRAPYVFYVILSVFLFCNAGMFLVEQTVDVGEEGILSKAVSFVRSSFIDRVLVYDIHPAVLVVVLGSILALYPGIWKFFFGIAKKVFSVLKLLPSNKSLDFVKRYFNIVRFANYPKQKRIFDKLVKLYAPDSKFVVLPMDMEYMAAGKPKQTYLDQLEEINEVFVKEMKNKEAMLPFVFVDPRRIRGKNGKEFFDWEIGEEVVGGKTRKYVKLKDCLLKKYLEKTEGDKSTGNFKGIKLYPALGYYPFDEDLLALYHYCVDHNLPIVTHCVVGTIFYRGNLKEEWNRHPVFSSADGTPLDTRTQSNHDLQVNFTHPLNYLVMLENKFLYRVINKSTDEKLKELFEFNPHIKHVSNKLSKLNINIAHYGGAEEWEKYLELDRSETSFELRENPEEGMSFTTSQSSGKQLLSKPAHMYRTKTDWFTIISSLMLQYENVYSDISYILHTEKMMPLLNDMMINNEKLAEKILFGTDFFVVRNHKSEKQLYSDLLAVIGEEKMDLISRDNPCKWLGL